MNDIYSRLQNKELNAFDIFVEEYSELILKVIHHNLAEVHLKPFVMECYNDTLLAIWEKIDSYNPKWEFKNWVAAIAKNKAIDYLRKINKVEQNECELILDVDIKKERSAEDIYMSKIKCDDILNLINDMDEINKTIIIQKVVLEKDTKEIASRLGLSNANVYKRIERMRKKILNNINGDEYHGRNEYL